MVDLLKILKKDFPNINYEPGAKFTWSPKDSVVIYSLQTATDDTIPKWSLLHETGHALLAHTSYNSDFELLEMEVQAWEKAKEISEKYDIVIDENHIEDCLDTYRDWLYARSTCPSCTACGVQTDSRTYRCLNCSTRWRVSPSRMCRPYRLKQKRALV